MKKRMNYLFHISRSLGPTQINASGYLPASSYFFKGTTFLLPSLHEGSKGAVCHCRHTGRNVVGCTDEIGQDVVLENQSPLWRAPFLFFTTFITADSGRCGERAGESKLTGLPCTPLISHLGVYLWFASISFCATTLPTLHPEWGTDLFDMGFFS